MDEGKDLHITVDPLYTEWQCTGCGNVLTKLQRPGYCPNCNCVDGDFGPLHQRLFIPREACGWFE